MLMEMLVYMAASTVLLGLASRIGWEILRTQKQITEVSEDLAAAVSCLDDLKRDLRNATRIEIPGDGRGLQARLPVGDVLWEYDPAFGVTTRTAPDGAQSVYRKFDGLRLRTLQPGIVSIDLVLARRQPEARLVESRLGPALSAVVHCLNEASR